MMLACVMPAASLAAGLAGPSLVLALATAPLQNAPDPTGPTAIEQALGERACTGAQSGGAAGYDAHGRCLDAQLLALRSEFGRDLNRLSTTKRRKLDSACSRLQTTQGRDAYLDCLHAGLALLPAPRSRARLPGPVETVLVAVPVNASLDARPLTLLSASLWSSIPLRSASAVLVTIGGAAVLLVVRARRARHACRVCAVRVLSSGELCPTCRHDAAEALRRGATERAARRVAHEDEQRRQREQEEQRQQTARAEEDARLRQEARRCEEARQRVEDARQREEDARRLQAEEFQRQQAAVCDNGESAFDPYVVLGLAQNPSDDEVRAAFEEARSKYDPEEVAHLGVDAQEHFAAKLRMAERAYQMLAVEVDPPAATLSHGELNPRMNW